MIDLGNVRPKTGVWNFLPRFLRNNTAHAIYPYIYIPPHIFKDLNSSEPSKIFEAIIVHEQTHIQRQQKMGLLLWLLVYIIYPPFRVEEELYALSNQLEYLVKKKQLYNLNKIAHSLSGYTYLWAISYDEALRRLKSIERKIIDSE